MIVADGIKLIFKETIYPTTSDKQLFILAPILSFTLSIIAWAVVPFGNGTVMTDLPLGIIYLLAISSLGVFPVLLAGWSANSKYALFGSLRTTAQMVSYEVFLGLLVLIVVFFPGSFNMIQIIESQQAIWYIVPLLPVSLLFLIAIIAETNRAPMDFRSFCMNM